MLRNLIHIKDGGRMKILTGLILILLLGGLGFAYYNTHRIAGALAEDSLYIHNIIQTVVRDRLLTAILIIAAVVLAWCIRKVVRESSVYWQDLRRLKKEVRMRELLFSGALLKWAGIIFVILASSVASVAMSRLILYRTFIANRSHSATISQLTESYFYAQNPGQIILLYNLSGILFVGVAAVVGACALYYSLWRN